MKIFITIMAVILIALMCTAIYIVASSEEKERNKRK